MSASPPDLSFDALFAWLSWLWGGVLPAVVLILGTTVGIAAINWIYTKLLDAMEAISEIINRLSPRV